MIMKNIRNITVILAVFMTTVGYGDMSNDVSIANNFLNQQKWTSATNAYYGLLQTYTNAPLNSRLEWINRLGIAKTRLDDIDSAIKTYQNGLLYSQSSKYFYNMFNTGIAQLYLRLGDKTNAIAYYKNVATNWGNVPSLWATRQILDIYSSSKDDDALIDFGLLAITNSPTYASLFVVPVVKAMVNKRQCKMAGDLILQFIGRTSSFEEFRTLLNSIATKIETVELRSSGNAVTSPGMLVKTKALIDAEKSGVGLTNALASFGFSIPSNFSSEVARVTTNMNDALDGWITPDKLMISQIEWYLGSDTANTFAEKYNGTNNIRSIKK